MSPGPLVAGGWLSDSLMSGIMGDNNTSMDLDVPARMLLMDAAERLISCMLCGRDRQEDESMALFVRNTLCLDRKRPREWNVEVESDSDSSASDVDSNAGDNESNEPSATDSNEDDCGAPDPSWEGGGELHLQCALWSRHSLYVFAPDEQAMRRDIQSASQSDVLALDNLNRTVLQLFWEMCSRFHDGGHGITKDVWDLYVLGTELLLERGCHINNRDHAGRTVVHLLGLAPYIRNGWLAGREMPCPLEWLKVFAARGADMKAETNLGQMVFHLLPELVPDFLSILEESFWLKHGVSIALATLESNLEECSSILSCILDAARIGPANGEYAALLHAAAEHVCEEGIVVLVQRGWSTTVVDVDGMTPLALYLEGCEWYEQMPIEPVVAMLSPDT
jgi:hypothetical protein